jgi:hypothetical protein
MNGDINVVRETKEHFSKHAQDNIDLHPLSIDHVPVLSQAKSLVKLIEGDADAAKKTQENFIKGTPIMLQVGAV